MEGFCETHGRWGCFQCFPSSPIEPHVTVNPVEIIAKMRSLNLSEKITKKVEDLLIEAYEKGREDYSEEHRYDNFGDDV